MNWWPIVVQASPARSHHCAMDYIPPILYCCTSPTWEDSMVLKKDHPTRTQLPLIIEAPSPSAAEDIWCSRRLHFFSRSIPIRSQYWSTVSVSYVDQQLLLLLVHSSSGKILWSVSFRSFQIEKAFDCLSWLAHYCSMMQLHSYYLNTVGSVGARVDRCNSHGSGSQVSELVSTSIIMPNRLESLAATISAAKPL